MLTPEDRVQQSAQILQSPAAALQRAMEHRDNCFPLKDAVEDNIIMAISIVGIASLLFFGILIDSLHPGASGWLSGAMILAVILASTVTTAISALGIHHATKYLLKPKYQRYIDNNPLQTTVAVKTQLHSNVLTTTLDAPWISEVIETQTLDIADEQSLKTVAQCRIQNEYCQQILNDWLDGNVKELPGGEEIEQRQQLTREHNEIAQRLLDQSLQLPTLVSDTTENRVR